MAKPMPRYLISRDATGAYRWVLRSVADSHMAESVDGYIDAKSCRANIEVFRRSAAAAELIDLTQPATVIAPHRQRGRQIHRSSTVKPKKKATKAASVSARKKKTKR